MAQSGRNIVQPDFLWEDKYAPVGLNEYVFQNEHIKTEITDIVHSVTLPSLLISGTQGTGKTTLARVLLHEFQVEKLDTLVINASRERGIDVIRETVANFCKTFPLGAFKVVLLEEADGLTPDAQASLRSTLDEFKKTVRFILTCNYDAKIIAPLKSRLREIHIEAFSTDELMLRAADILEKEQVKVEDLGILEQYINQYNPDLRKIIVALQQASTTGVLLPAEQVTGLGVEAIDQWRLCWERGDIAFENLMTIIRGGVIDNSNYEQYYRIMYDNLYGNPTMPKALDVANSSVIIAEHLYRGAFVADQEINMCACLIRMLKL